MSLCLEWKNNSIVESWYANDELMIGLEKNSRRKRKNQISHPRHSLGILRYFSRQNLNRHWTSFFSSRCGSWNIISGVHTITLTLGEAYTSNTFVVALSTDCSMGCLQTMIELISVACPASPKWADVFINQLKMQGRLLWMSVSRFIETISRSIFSFEHALIATVTL